MRQQRAFQFLLGAVFIYQVLAYEKWYSAELLVESNTTLDTFSIASLLDLSTFQVNDSSGVVHWVELRSSKVIAECQISGIDYLCSCSSGYIWSNEVCYNENCCRETPCQENVMNIQPLCIPKEKVRISGDVMLNTTTWDDLKTTQLQEAFEVLNGFEYLDVVGQRESGTIADFKAELSVKCSSGRLQAIISSLESSLEAVLKVNTEGLVTMRFPSSKVEYLSQPKLKCFYNEATESSKWTIGRWGENYDLMNGTMVKLDYTCVSGRSCVFITIMEMTDLWAGTYECAFKKGSVRHTALKTLSVSLLPDTVSMKFNPLTVDCSDKGADDFITVDVTATIERTNETYVVWWSYMENKMNYITNKLSDGSFLYIFKVPISCKKTSTPHVVSLSFRNADKKEKTQNKTIPVINAGILFCGEEALESAVWPKTPTGDTVFNDSCPLGRVGYTSRTCSGTTWMPVYYQCVSKELNKLHFATEIFSTGMGTTKEKANEIFEILKNNSNFSNSSDGLADIDTSVKILEVMSKASESIEFEETLLPYFAEAASNMVNQTWSQINSTMMHRMSSMFLHSMEDLVKNVKVNKTNGYKTENLDIAYCYSKDCNTSAFHTSARLNSTSGTFKTVVVKNLMDKLRNNINGSVTNSLLISATLEENNDHESLQVNLQFPTESSKSRKPMCVFWNTTEDGWSSVGCVLESHSASFTTCHCNHLTSFSVLMAKSDISTEELDVITVVGLSLSVACLIIFLFVEYLVWSAVIKTPLSHFRHTAMVNIATFLLLADCSFLASTAPEDLSDSWCLIFTICKHLFFLAMFSWMLCLSVLLVHQLIFVFHPLRKRVFMFLSSFAGYFCPLIIVGTSYVYYEYTDMPYYNSDTCWLVFEELLNGSVHAFFIPVATIILTNLFSLVVVIVTLVKTSTPKGSKSDDKETAKGILKVMLVLTPVFGVTWVIGFFLMLLDEDSIFFMFANYSFTILNSFQGVFILVTGCVLEQKVRAELWKIIVKKTTGNNELSSNSTLTSTVKDK